MSRTVPASAASIVSNDIASPQKRMLEAGLGKFSLPKNGRRKKTKKNAVPTTTATANGLDKNCFQLIHVGKSNVINQNDMEAPCGVLMIGDGYADYVLGRPFYGRAQKTLWGAAREVLMDPEKSNAHGWCLKKKGADGLTQATETYYKGGEKCTKKLSTIYFDVGKNVSEAQVLQMYQEVIAPTYRGLSQTFTNGFDPKLSAKPHLATETLSDAMLDHDILTVIKDIHCDGEEAEQYFKQNPSHLYSCWKVGEVPLAQISELNLTQRELHATDYERWNNFVQAEEDLQRNGIQLRTDELPGNEPPHVANTHPNTVRQQAQQREEEERQQAQREEEERQQAQREEQERQAQRDAQALRQQEAERAGTVVQAALDHANVVDLNPELAGEGQIHVETVHSDSDDDEFQDAHQHSNPFISDEAQEALQDSDEEDEQEFIQ